MASIEITTLETVGSLQLSGSNVTLNQVITKADIDAGNLKFVPVANANGSSYDSFAFSVNDGTTDSASSYTLTVDVTAVNDAPTAATNTVTTTEDTTYTFSASDFSYSDIEGSTMASIKVTTLETAGALQLSGVDVTLDQVITKANIDSGNLKFVPAANANGSSYDSFAFSVNDGTTDSASSYTLTIDVTAVNDEPTLSATGSDPTFTEGDSAVSLFSGTAVSTVESGQTITGLTFTVTNVTDTGNEQITIDGATITLDDSESGSTTDFSYSVSVSGTTATVTLSGGTASTANVVSDIDNATYINNSQDPTNANRVVMITAVVDSGGTSNGGDNTGTPVATSTVDVDAVNDAPTASANTVTTNEDTTYTFTASDFNFSDVDGDTLASIKVTTLETVGALQLSGVDVTLNQVITKADIDAGNLKFVPVANANGSSYDSFAFSVNDGTTDSASSYTLTVDVTAVNDAPTAAANTVTTNEDTTYTFSASDFSYSDIDSDTMASIEITTLESTGALQLSGVDVTLNQVITKANIDAGNLKFVPTANANGSSYDSFAFSVNDGTADSASSYTLTVDVTAVNDAPTAAANTVTTNEDTTFTFSASDFSFSDID
ncbi:MAG: tandem-95 repeat protein, partial [Gammaproteobacteria bacterium]|nr:tandem-95 repeat protein [Gammaproteobacteria bacterium]